MKAFLISDLHGDHYLGGKPSDKKIKEFYNNRFPSADALIIAGDISNYSTCTAKIIDYFSSVYEKVIWVNGNHDYLVHESNSDSNVKFKNTLKKIQNKSHHCLSENNYLEYGNSRIGGSIGWYDFSYAMKHFGLSEDVVESKWKTWFDAKYTKFPQFATSMDHFKSEKKIMESLVYEQACDIMVTHMGPIAHEIPYEFHNYMTGFFYFDGLEMVESMSQRGGKYWFYGHTHNQHWFNVGNMVIACNPFGYPHENVGNIPYERFIFEV